MVLAPGLHTFRRDPEPHRPATVLYASASAPEPSWLRAALDRGHGAVLIEEVFLGASSPHTWWGNNPLFTDELLSTLTVEDRLLIEVGPGARLRLETNLWRLDS